MHAMIEYVVRELVDEPVGVVVDEVIDDTDTTTFRVRVAPGDIGKVIGKQGRIANAIRVIAKAAAMKDKRKIYVDIPG